MSAIEVAREELAALSRRLGDPGHEFAILGEGNAGVAVDAVQLVTASGSRLASAAPEDMVALDRRALLAELDGTADGDQSWSRAVASTVRDAGTKVATIEAALHAVASLVTGSPWTAHTHPVAVTGILSSDAGRRFAAAPLFPDQVVMTGPSACYLPYTDPGRPLATAFRDALHDHADRVGQWPRVVLLANHGMVAIGETAGDVFEITQMTDKAARIFLAAGAAGVVEPLSAAAVRRIDTRPDEDFRRRALRGDGEERR